MGTFLEWSNYIHDWAHRKKFYKNTKCSAPDCEHISESIAGQLMLVVSELAEAMEADRKGDKANFREELADTLIRLLDICGCLGIDIEKEIANKMKKNEKRPERHNKRY